jgi:hypothetical protein
MLRAEIVAYKVGCGPRGHCSVTERGCEMKGTMGEERTKHSYVSQPTLEQTSGWVEFARRDPCEIAHKDLLEGTQNACRDECALVYGAERDARCKTYSVGVMSGGENRRPAGGPMGFLPF